MSLSYTSQLGYYGLRVNPTLEEVLYCVRKPLRIPLPDRRAKWYALSPYRALILDAEAKYNEHESATIDYRNSGAELPEHAARVRPSDAGADGSFNRIDENNRGLALQHAYETAKESLDSNNRSRASEMRTETLRAQHGPAMMNPVLEAHHDSLSETGVSHFMPGVRSVPTHSLPAPPPAYVAAGQLQAPEFPSFEVLSMGQPANVLAARLSPEQNMTYEHLRDFVAQPTWSS